MYALKKNQEACAGNRTMTVYTKLWNNPEQKFVSELNFVSYCVQSFYRCFFCLYGAFLGYSLIRG